AWSCGSSGAPCDQQVLSYRFPGRCGTWEAPSLHAERRRSLDLGLLELGVLANHRVVVLAHALVRSALPVLGGGVEIPADRGGHETDKLTARFAFLCHERTPCDGHETPGPLRAREYLTHPSPLQGAKPGPARPKLTQFDSTSASSVASGSP